MGGSKVREKRDWARFEGADFLLDMETIVPNRKRSLNLSAENGTLDANYVSFLQGLLEYWNAKFSEGEEDDEEEEEVVDPSYEDFFNSLRPHCNAYMCDVSEENGVYEPIIYEEDRSSVRKAKGGNARMSVSQKKYLRRGRGDVKSVRTDSVAEDVSCDVSRKRIFDRVVDRKSRGRKSESGSDHSGGMKKRRKVPTSSRDDHLREDRMLALDAEQRPRPKRSNFEKNTPEVDEVYKCFIDKLECDRGNTFFTYGDQTRVYYEPHNQQQPGVPVEPCDTVTALSVPSPPTPVSGPLTSPPGAQISKPRKPSPKDAQMGQNPSNKELNNIEQIRKQISSYQRELLGDLRRPYDQDEYDELYEFMSARKPVQIYRESRSGGSYRLGHMGKSYLDLYPDLKCEIEKVKYDHHKVLNLLRMCKIYVQKIPSLPIGYKKPWMEDLFLTILPGLSDNCQKKLTWR